MTTTREHPKEADICLLLESTYPYVRGGVSSWVHQLISGLPEFTFALFFIGSTRNNYQEQCYTLPANVVDLQTVFIMERDRSVSAKARTGKRAVFQAIEEIHASFREGTALRADLFQQLIALLTTSNQLTLRDFLFGKLAWEKIRYDYKEFCDHPSFIDYFWLIRTLHLPIFALAKIVPSVPNAKLYHSISTGYAGFVGSILCRQRKSPLILSEHGIYTKERKIDLAKAVWIADQKDPFKTGMNSDIGYLRKVSISFFEALGKMTYEVADPIISLSQANRKKQIEDGAAEQTTLVIANGINLARFQQIREKRSDQGPPLVLGLIGRVVPIKDVKTFIRAVRILCNYMPEAEGWIIGPEDEDGQYAKECRVLTEHLDLAGNLKFLGFQRIDELLPKLGLLVLTSISEGQPLVILEAFAAGLPVVATDVGFCRGMIEGEGDEDCQLGRAGAVTPIADPSATAHAAMDLLGNVAKYNEAAKTAVLRVERYYDELQLFDRYRTIYNKTLNGYGGNRI